jgi:hypothetical protein
MTQARIDDLQHHVEHLLQHTKVLHLESHATLLNKFSVLCHKCNIFIILLLYRFQITEVCSHQMYVFCNEYFNPVWHLHKVMKNMYTFLGIICDKTFLQNLNQITDSDNSILIIHIL